MSLCPLLYIYVSLSLSRNSFYFRFSHHDLSWFGFLDTELKQMSGNHLEATHSDPDVFIYFWSINTRRLAVRRDSQIHILWLSPARTIHL